MNSFAEVLRAGDGGGLAVDDWARMRSALCIFVIAGEEPAETVPFDRQAFEAQWPEGEPEDYPAPDAFGSFRLYAKARGVILKLFAATGHHHGSWNDLFRVVRAAGVPADKINKLHLLRTHALLAGLSPSQLTREWALKTDSVLSGSEKAGFRSGLMRLDALHDVPAVAPSGLLPPRIGTMPRYIQGRERPNLPPTLTALHDTLDPETETGKAIRLALVRVYMMGLALKLFTPGVDISASDMLKAWPVLRKADPSVIRVPAKTWRNYTNRARLALERHVDPDSQPAWGRLVRVLKRSGRRAEADKLAPLRIDAEAAGIEPNKINQKAVAALVAEADRTRATRLRTAIRTLNTLRLQKDPELKKLLPVANIDVIVLGGRGKKRLNKR